MHFPITDKDEDDLTPLTRENLSLADLKKTWMAGGTDTSVVFISAKEKTNIEELKSVLYDRIKEIHISRYPYDNLLYNE
jgi:GTP-binding protein HflX